MQTRTTDTSCPCPECGASVQFPADVMLGEILACDDCAAELEVLAAAAPVALGLAPEIQEDWGE